MYAHIFVPRNQMHVYVSIVTPSETILNSFLIMTLKYLSYFSIQKILNQLSGELLMN